MTTTIYLTRHGEVHNPKQIWYGRMPRFRLTDLGKKEIGETAKHLQKKSISAIYSSPLLRAKQTAEIIMQQLDIPKVKYTKDLLEIRSSLEGKTLEYMQSIHFDNYSEKYRKETDETMEEIAARIQSFFDMVHAKHAGEHVVAVTHGDTLMIALALAQHKPMITSSVRGNEYVHHGEVLEVTIDKAGILAVKSDFKPL